MWMYVVTHVGSGNSNCDSQNFQNLLGLLNYFTFCRPWDFESVKSEYNNSVINVKCYWWVKYNVARWRNYIANNCNRKSMMNRLNTTSFEIPRRFYRGDRVSGRVREWMNGALLQDLHNNRIVVSIVIVAMDTASQSQREEPSLSLPARTRGSFELLSCTLTPVSLFLFPFLPRAHILYGIPSCSRPGKLRALIKFSLGTLTERGPSFIKRRIKVIFP